MKGLGPECVYWICLLDVFNKKGPVLLLGRPTPHPAVLRGRGFLLATTYGKRGLRSDSYGRCRIVIRNNEVIVGI